MSGESWHRSRLPVPQTVFLLAACACPLHRIDFAAQDPGVLADLPSSREPVLLEQLGGRAEQEPALGLPSGGHLRDHFDEAAAGSGDLGECALQPRPRDAAAAMALVDETFPNAGPCQGATA